MIDHATMKNHPCHFSVNEAWKKTFANPRSCLRIRLAIAAIIHEKTPPICTGGVLFLIR
jgi:hypothetical protein